MNRFVMDCSVTMAWCFEDETSPYADNVLTRLAIEEAVVPSLWSLEVANVLLVGERRKRLKPADTARFITLLRALPIRIEVDTPYRALDDILTVGRDQTLSAYDAAYLELAMREGLPFATLDERLRNVAVNLGITVITI